MGSKVLEVLGFLALLSIFAFMSSDGLVGLLL